MSINSPWLLTKEEDFLYSTCLELFLGRSRSFWNAPSCLFCLDTSAPSRYVFTNSDFIECFTPPKKCPHWDLFWLVFSLIWTEYREILGISSQSVWMQRNKYQNNSEYGHFLKWGNLFTKWDNASIKKWTNYYKLRQHNLPGYW